MNDYPGDYKLKDGRILRLLRLEELRRWQDVEPDKVLTDIFGQAIFAKDCDDDIRYGFVAAGFEISTEVLSTRVANDATISERKG